MTAVTMLTVRTWRAPSSVHVNMATRATAGSATVSITTKIICYTWLISALYLYSFSWSFVTDKFFKRKNGEYMHYSHICENLIWHMTALQVSTWLCSINIFQLFVRLECALENRCVRFRTTCQAVCVVVKETSVTTEARSVGQMDKHTRVTVSCSCRLVKRARILNPTTRDLVKVNIWINNTTTTTTLWGYILPKSLT